jgi:hypothetical protein
MANNYVTGQIITIDGGETLSPDTDPHHLGSDLSVAAAPTQVYPMITER